MRAIVLMVVSMALFALEDMFLKLALARQPLGQVLLILGVVGAVIFARLAAREGQRVLTPALASPALLARNIGEMIGTWGFVTALATIPLTTATAVFQAIPLAVTMAAALVLGETVGWRRWLAVGTGFMGMLLIIRPGGADFSAALLWPLLAVAGLTVRDIATRRIPDGIGTMQVASSGMGSVALLGLILVLAGDAPVWPGPAGAWPIAAATVCGIAGYWAITAAMRVGEVSAVTPFRYMRLVFALVIGTTVFAERPDALTLAGSGLIVGSGLYAAWRERKRQRKR
ncbi:DMT family transporter [Frigidibacter oleivorans]|uniref:DMT family transporter n=1 Tax=Frigidibacter oleivorans TaxID=2487129 RepID=UPI002E259615